MRASKVSWTKFCSEMQSVFKGRPLGIVLECIRETDSPTAIILCVDELIKSAQPMQVSSTIGCYLNEYGWLDVVISTLDWTPIKTAMQTSSQRDITWTRLEPLPADTVVTFMPDPKQKHVKLMIAFCNGHPRSLANLHLFLKSSNWNDGPHFFQFLGARIIESAIAEQLTVDHIRLALAGKPISRDTKISNDTTVKDAIRAGLFLNSLNPTGAVTPVVSPLMLHSWATANQGNMKRAISQVADSVKLLLEW